MFCSRCGNTLADGAAYCNRCGNPTTAGLPSVTVQRPGVITLLSVLYLIFGPILVLGSIAALIGGFTSHESDAGIAIVVGIFMLVIGALYVAVGVGLLKMRPWARTTQIVLSCVGLLGFPMGTIINGLILYYMFRPGVVALFSGRSAQELTGPERASVLELQKSSTATVIAVLAVVVGVIFFAGILAAIAIPNLLTAMQRAKQKRTIADMQSIGSALSAYAAIHKEYPNTADMNGLTTALMPEYMKTVPTVDGWSNPLRYKCWSSTSSVCDHFALSSGGKDGKFEWDDVQDYGDPHANTNFDCDIVYSDSGFISYPEGTQQ